MKMEKVKRKTGKGKMRALSMFMAAALVMTGINMPVFSVEASGESHSHDTWTAWSNTSAMPDTAGNYYLDADVNLAGTAWSVPTGTTNLCLNGHTITQSETQTQSVIVVPANAIFNLYDENDQGKITGGYAEYGGGVCVQEDAQFTMNGGQVTGNTATHRWNGGSGGGIAVKGGKFRMNGGIISNNHTTEMHGGGITVRDGGEAVMTGGKITGNVVQAYGGSGWGGGGVYIQGGASFTMSDGEISDNEASNSGGGVNVDGTFTMSGGTITGNTAKGTADGGGGVGNFGKFIMNGGTITGNTAEHGGGVLYSHWTNESMKFSGAIVIRDNQNTSSETDNVYLEDNKTITIIDGGLQNSSHIGVKTRVTPTESSAVNLTGTNDKDYSVYFVSDNGYAIRNEDNILKMGGTPLTDEEKVSRAKSVVENAWAKIEVTNDTTKENIQTAINQALTQAGLGGVTATVGEITKTDATQEAAGSIGAEVSIESGSVSDKVNLSKQIDKLPKSDAELLAAAKTAIEEALRGMEATNDVTKESILELIQSALEKEGITDIEIGGDVAVTPATTSADGSIDIDLSITIGEETDTIVLDKKIDKLPDTGTTETDAEKVTKAKETVENVLKELVVTNSTTKEEIQAAIDEKLSEAGLDDVTVTVGNITKTEATTGADGSITGSITITKGEETDTASINKKIDKLPDTGTTDTDAEKVTKAKETVENVLKDLPVTNSTTKEDIQEAIDEELRKAGLDDVTVTVGNITKTEATTGADGSITGSITITKGNETDTAPINKKIDKLPDTGTSTDTEKVSDAKEKVEDVIKELPVSNDITKEDIQAAVDDALREAGLTDVEASVEEITKTEATVNEAGRIVIKITFTKGDVTENVEINKIIDKLPQTDKDKVSEAKQAVENALGKIAVTNGTTKENIQTVVNEALKGAGLTDVEASVGEITKTEATVNEAGRIVIKVTFTKGDVTESIEITKTIPKLQQNTSAEPDKPGGAAGEQGSLTDEQKQQVQTIAKELGVPEETAVKIQKIAEELGIPMETLLLGEGAFTGHGSEDDVKGSLFSALQLKASKVSTNSVKLTWKKIKGADGYYIYGAQCLKGNKLKLVKTIEKGSTTNFTQKKLKKGKAYRYVVRAYKIVDGKRITIAASKSVHIFTNGGKYGNAKSVKVNKTKASIKKGKKFKIKASEVKMKKPIRRHRKLSYESSNTKVATVTKKGVIKAVAKGTCTVYVYAQNGVYKKIKVTVK